MAYEQQFVEDLEGNFIIWDYIIYFMLAIFSISTLISFALIISCLLRKIFISSIRYPNPQATSASHASAFRNKRHFHGDGYDECNCRLCDVDYV